MAYGELEDLEIFRIAERVADRFYELVREWTSLDRETIGMQLIRAADSIGANIAESHGRYYYGDQIRFLYYARGSLYEVKYWVRRAESRGLLHSDTSDKALSVLDDLALKLNTYIRNIRRRQKGPDSVVETGFTYQTHSAFWDDSFDRLTESTPLDGQDELPLDCPPDD